MKNNGLIVKGNLLYKNSSHYMWAVQNEKKGAAKTD